MPRIHILARLCEHSRVSRQSNVSRPFIIPGRVLSLKRVNCVNILNKVKSLNSLLLLGWIFSLKRINILKFIDLNDP